MTFAEGAAVPRFRLPPLFHTPTPGRSSPAAPAQPAPAVPAAPASVPTATPAMPTAVPAAPPAPAARAAELLSERSLDRQLGALGAGGAQPVRAALADALSVVPPTPPAAPSAPSIQRLYDDKAFQSLYGFVMGRLEQVASGQRSWDKLWQVKGFVEASQFVLQGTALPGQPSVDEPPLFQRFTGAQERRALCHLLLLLMPEETRTERPMQRDGSRAAPQSLFEPFPDAVIARADEGFALRAGDLPKVAPVFTAPLGTPALIDSVFRRGQQGTFLASKSFCPGAMVQDRKDIHPTGTDKRQQSGHTGDPIFVKIDDVIEVDGRKMAKVHVPAQHKQWMGDHGGTVQGHQVLGQIDHVIDVHGQPVLGADGKPQDILIPVDHLADYLFDPGRGTGAGGLDLTRSEDRAIALCYGAELKQRYLTDSTGTTRSLFDWLEQASATTPPEDLTRIKREVRDAAWQAVAKHACHPRRTHFKIDLGGEKGDWQHQAFDLLNSTGMMQDCGNRYEKDKSSTQDMHELAWTSKFLERGFVGGSLDCYGLADAFDRLQATFLTPLGVLTTTDISEGHGAELVRILEQPDAAGVVQAGELYKSKLNELITAVDVRISSGRGPAAEYMENWPGYLDIAPPTKKRSDLAAAQKRLEGILHALDAGG